MTPTRQLMTRQQVAEYLGLTPQALSQASHRMQGPPFYRVGGAIRYDRADVDAWLESRRVDPSAATANT